MDEINVVMREFAVRLQEVIDAEVKRQTCALIATLPAEDVAGEKPARKPYAKAQPKPCPTCGTLNMARRFRFYCAEHRA